MNSSRARPPASSRPDVVVISDDEGTTAKVSREAATPMHRKAIRDETAQKKGSSRSVPVGDNDDDDDDDFEEGTVRKRKEGAKKAGGKSRRGSAENHEEGQDDGQGKKKAKRNRRRSTPEPESAQNGDVSDSHVSDSVKSPKMFAHSVPVQKGGCLCDSRSLSRALHLSTCVLLFASEGESGHVSCIRWLTVTPCLLQPVSQNLLRKSFFSNTVDAVFATFLRRMLVVFFFSSCK